MRPPTMGNALKNHIAQSNAPSPRFEGLEDVVSSAAQNLTGRLANWMGSIRDRSEILALSRQVEAVLSSHQGVLLIRVIKSMPEPGGGRIEQYIGLRVVGGGANEADAIYRYERNKQGDGQQAKNVCTVAEANSVRGPTISASTSPLNPYDGVVAERELEVRRRNPHNIPSGLFVAADTIEYKYVFFSKPQWEQIKKGR